MEATNNFVVIVRDETLSEKMGLKIPDEGQEKPSKGLIYSTGELVADKKIKKGKHCLFHKGVGFNIVYEDKEYLFLTDNEVIAIV